MEATLTRKKGFTFNRKLTPEEIENVIENYDYGPYWYEKDDIEETEPIYDKFGNPTESTIRAFYESEHDLGEETTIEELFAWVDSLK